MFSEGRVIWITGLSGAGKSTLASKVTDKLRSREKHVVLLDGDELREVLGAIGPIANNYDRAGRVELSMRYARLCRVLAIQGLTVVIATISLYREIHTWNRANIPDYFEVYLRVPVDELRRRDPKQIYARFDAGELANVAGMDLPIDEPKNADWVVDFHPQKSPTILADELLELAFTRKE